ncbi:MAG: TRAM domain-containing protein [Armatimonadetes bacterium]|nr:TRAM domain-containing protein [Armatimonadota bacterium]
MDRRLSRLKNTTTGDKVSLGLSLLIGIVCSFPVFVVLNTVSPRDAGIITPIVTIALAVLVMYIFKTIEEALPWYKLTGKPIKTGFKILDTSVIIDGRIYDVARIGFLEGRIYVPKFVLEELQHIADSSDALRRQRGRRGLDVLKLMQSQFELEVGSFDKFAPNEDEEVDSRLVRLAKALGAELVTNDVNLNRVATLQDVRVLNLNDLAMALKPNVLPRESLSLVVVREGSQYGQGVGYLDDGTMVVVENGRRFIGENVTVQVTQVIQTERGKMIFAEAPTEDESPTEPGNGRKRPYTRKNES